MTISGRSNTTNSSSMKNSAPVAMQCTVTGCTELHRNVDGYCHNHRAEAAGAPVAARTHVIFGTYVAVKIVPISYAKKVSIEADKVKTEADKVKTAATKLLNMLKPLNHENIVSIYDYTPQIINCSNEKTHIYVVVSAVLECCEQSLFDKIRHSNSQNWSFDERLKIVIQIATGMQYLHDNLICHRDLKPGNVLLTRNATGDDIAKITDFGASCVFNTLREQKPYGTDEYKGPELFSLALPNKGQTQSISASLTDIYSFGVLLWNVFSGNADPLNNAYDNLRVQKSAAEWWEQIYIQNLRPPITDIENYWKSNVPNTKQEKVCNLMQQCWDSKQENRPSSFENIIQFIKTFDKLENRRCDDDGGSSSNGNGNGDPMHSQTKVNRCNKTICQGPRTRTDEVFEDNSDY